MERKEVEELIIKLKHIAPYIEKNKEKLLLGSEDVIGAIEEEGLDGYGTAEMAFNVNEVVEQLYPQLERQKLLIEKLINYVEAGFKGSKEPPLDFYISVKSNQDF